MSTTASDFDATIEVQVSRRGAAWAYELQPRAARRIEATGRVPFKGATRHALIAVGITSALMAIHPKEWERLRGTKLKPSVVIDVPDEQFIRAIEFRRRSKAQPRDGFRVGANLLRPLYEQLLRFDVTFRFAKQEAKTAAELSSAERLLRSWFSFPADVYAPALLAR